MNHAENPTGFVRVYSAEFGLLSSTALPGVIPAETVPLSNDRFPIVGQARDPTAPESAALIPRLALGVADQEIRRAPISELALP